LKSTIIGLGSPINFFYKYDAEIVIKLIEVDDPYMTNIEVEDIPLNFTLVLGVDRYNIQKY